MLRIKFGPKYETVSLTGEEATDIVLVRDYGCVEVEYYHAREFWVRVLQPLGVIRLGQKAKEMGDQLVAMLPKGAEQDSDN